MTLDHSITQNVLISVEGGTVGAFLSIPKRASKLVIFVHGSGSSRHSTRNQSVARELNHVGIATLLADLLTAEEEEFDKMTAHIRFDIDFLTERTLALHDWAKSNQETSKFRKAFFGASTGAAAALQAAAKLPSEIYAVVSRGGRPDLAGKDLNLVHAPTLFIIGGLDTEVLAFNQEAFAQLRCMKQLEVVEGAMHLFEEPGTLEQVSKLAVQWFFKHS
ncbi:MAG: dienelactone hydrolase family protein [Deltaproteobacteria bacterium]|nr:dienelactone hydrolase family protein [Deltaproteobacteria bacterium]